MMLSIISWARVESACRCCTVRKISLLPAFEVAMMMVLRAFTFVPRLSVNIPSSRICKKISWIDCRAFSNSSSNMTEYGCSRSIVGSVPAVSPSPMSFSSASSPLNSDISMRCIFPSPPKKMLARALAVSVFPTPVGPKNKNEPMGFSADWIPALARRIVRAIALKAASCPITCWCSLSSRCNNMSRSVSWIGPAGTPVFSLTTA